MAVHTTKQDVFNIVWQEFVVDGRQQAYDREEDKCVYRGSDPDTKKREADSDMRCLVGVCIPDDMYDPELEYHGGISNVYNNMSEWYESVFNGIDVAFLSSLQRAHDDAGNSEFTADITARLRGVAEDHGLTIPGE